MSGDGSLGEDGRLDVIVNDFPFVIMLHESEYISCFPSCPFIRVHTANLQVNTD